MKAKGGGYKNDKTGHFENSISDKHGAMLISENNS